MTKLAEFHKKYGFNVYLHILFVSDQSWLHMTNVKSSINALESGIKQKSLSPTTSIDFSNLCLPYIHHFSFHSIHIHVLLDVKAMNEMKKINTRMEGWIYIFTPHSGNKRRKNMHWKFSNGISIFLLLPFCAKKDFSSCKLFSSWENRQRNVTKWNSRVSTIIKFYLS